ncbi:MAG: DNA polymerase III subunit delta [Melioribacteraceae bacterium]|nr:DNA polymerase III subunit delta [Melioribacteraceae bacterium]
MSKYKTDIPSIYSLVSDSPGEALKPIYFLFGSDHFSINTVIKSLSSKIEPLISSDFDKETISVEKKSNISDLIDLAYTFPFGSEKKLIIVKNFENFNNKKQFESYVNDPSEKTLLIIANYGDISSLKASPYSLLEEKGYIFEARELKGIDLENWVTKRSNQLGFKIGNDSIRTLIEIVGEDKSLLEMQLQKFKTYLGDKDEIKSEDIKTLSSAMKEYSIFDLLNTMGKGNISDSIKVIFNLLSHGKDLVFIVNMLTKYISVISQSIELRQRKLSDFDASKAIGVSKYYYQNCKNAQYFGTESRLHRASKALYNTDLALKTTSIDQKTLSVMMLTEIFTENGNIYRII